MKKEKTCRGFSIIKFKDSYDNPCSLQMSSSAMEDKIWLGIDDANPQICAPGNCWIKYDIPKEVMLHTRMHLTKDQVKDLLPHLQKFVKTGEI